MALILRRALIWTPKSYYVALQKVGCVPSECAHKQSVRIMYWPELEDLEGKQWSVHFFQLTFWKS